jgi:hypothetical protein
MAGPPVRYRVAIDLTPEQYVLAHALVQQARTLRYSPAGTFDLDGVLRFSLSLGFSELAKLMDELEAVTRRAKPKRKARRPG